MSAKKTYNRADGQRQPVIKGIEKFGVEFWISRQMSRTESTKCA